MNAGAFGKYFGARVQELHIISPDGKLEVKDRTQLKFAYRHFEMAKGAVIIRVGLKLESEPKKIVAERVANYLRKRKQSQPLEYPNAGSVFKNPSHAFAGRLIERAGLKGKRIGGAMISEKHANFIVNTGGAKAKDILDLLYLAQAEVKKRTGIELEPEIKIIGD
jgi:UDP-N-acetylmuramate dehydrogenase